MQDLKIEYREGKLIELSIDGISFSSLTAISLHHQVGETLPTVTLTIPIGTRERLVPNPQPRENLRIIEK